MWLVTTEDDIRCRECSHSIPSGTQCLSQVPPTMPQNFRRGKYENFCVKCADCDAEPELRSRVCYARRLDHWYTHREKTAESVQCAHCLETIPEKTITVAQKLYAWPETDAEQPSQYGDRPEASVLSGAATGTVNASPSGWLDLSYATRQKFRTAGLGGSRGIRTLPEAQRFYETSVPQFVRNAGEGAVKDFLNGKQASHIRSVANSPSHAKSASNIVWEEAAKNTARGSRNMSAAELAAAKSAGRISAVKAGAKTAVRSGAKAGLIAAALEAAVSVPENAFHYRRGRKSSKQAAKDTAKSTATAAGVGVATAGVAKGAAMAGLGLSLGPFGTPVMIAGGIVLAGSAFYRINKAAKRDLPLDEYRVFFCKNSQCNTRFARELTDSALAVQQ